MQRTVPVIVALAAVLTLALAGPPAAAAERPGSQVLIEMGYARPFGDLADDFEQSELGFGAGAGLEIGFRWRYHLSRSLSVSPAFHYLDYNDYEGQYPEYGVDVGGQETVEYVDYRVGSSSFHWTVEFLLSPAERTRKVRPFVAVAGGLYRNRVQSWTKEFTEVFDRSVNTFGVGLRAGIEVSSLEFSLVYGFNRFSTYTFYDTGTKQPYDWDSLTVRGAWIVPFSY